LLVLLSFSVPVTERKWSWGFSPLAGMLELSDLIWGRSVCANECVKCKTFRTRILFNLNAIKSFNFKAKPAEFLPEKSPIGVGVWLGGFCNSQGHLSAFAVACQTSTPMSYIKEKHTATHHMPSL